MSRRAWSWAAAVAVAAAAFLYGVTAESPPRTNADRVHQLAQGLACPVCAGQSVAESDVSVAREIRRQIAVWVDEGRSDAYIREQIVSVYGEQTDYNPPASGLSSLVWILPLVASGGIGAVLVFTLRSARRRAAVADDQPPRTSRRRWRAVAAWTAAVVLFTAAAGVLVARFSGSRGVGDSITGEIRVTARELNFQALEIFNEGDIDGAIALYDEALQQQPSNAEALTYRGWLTSRRGDAPAAVAYLDDAIASDPDYADARLFRAIVALDAEDAERAASEMAAFDALDPSPDAEALVAQARVRERVAEAVGVAALRRVDAVYSAPDRGAFGPSGLTVADAVAAAEARASQGCEGCLLDALQMLDWVLESSPADADVLAGRGWLLVRTGDAELLELGMTHLDEALSVEPARARALVYRVFAHAARGDTAAARADLDAFDSLQARPPDLVRLIEDQGLRTALGR